MTEHIPNLAAALALVERKHLLWVGEAGAAVLIGELHNAGKVLAAEVERLERELAEARRALAGQRTAIQTVLDSPCMMGDDDIATLVKALEQVHAL